VAVVLAIGIGLVIWKKNTAHGTAFNSITRGEIEMLLADVAKTNPMVLKRLAEDPAMKKQQIENLKQLLAFASQAEKEGIAAEPGNKQELENIRAEILAVNYDREINKDKGPMPPFGFISEEQVNAFWAENPEHENEFNEFLNSKLEVLKATNPDMKDRQITDEERTQARDVFAKIRIYRNEYEQKVASGELDKAFVDKANLQVKLQQAQFLARLYSEKAADKLKATDEEIDKYIADHPEIDPAQKKAKAQAVLDRAKAGEDFVALANEFSEDPGNKGAKGEPQGGAYKDVPKGRMIAGFEAAALALEPGQVAPELVETDFGYHIIKLDRKLEKKGKEETYDVRHILFSTGVKDEKNPSPMAREVPVKDYVRSKIEEEKEKKLLEEIVAQNNVQVPDDFTVPEITEDQMKQMQQQQQQQMQMQAPPGPGDEDDLEAPDAKEAPSAAKGKNPPPPPKKK
jgi:parvulin-like peptidyl-prolyl isomerase